MMKLITRFLAAFFITATLFTAGCALRLTDDDEEELPPAEPVAVNLPSEGAPATAPSAGTNVSSEAYYESTANERQRMMEGTNERPDLDNTADTGTTTGSPAEPSGSQETTTDTGAGGGQETDAAPDPAPKVGNPIEGREGYITSPNSDDPEAIIDVRGLPPGTEIKDPHSPGSTILVP
jgi:hypothetical protein